MDVYLASANTHKWEEFVTMANKLKLPIKLKSACEIGGMPEVAETGETLEDNARLKGEALLAAVPAGSWVLADDSGLIVDALDGAPGVHSSRFAGPGGNATANNIKLLKVMKGLPMDKRTARFSCVLYFACKEEAPRIFEGHCEGHITIAPSGLWGFGYDPLFQPIGYGKTFAALGNAVKNSLSHRGRAVAAWGIYLRSRNP